MKSLLLAAGYGTRLYPLTKTTPKALLMVGGKPVIDYSVEQINQVDQIDEIFLITNDRFAPQFVTWAATAPTEKPIRIVNDGTTTDENRLGAIRDIAFAMEHGDIFDPLLVMGCDNIFEWNLEALVQFYNKKHSNVLCALYEEKKEILSHSGVVSFDQDGKVIDFAEKPANPKSQYLVPPIYIFTPYTLPRIREYLSEGNNPDAPGHFIAWLHKIETIYAFRSLGKRWDIGSREGYEKAVKHFSPVRFS
ncbi:MAG: nucleotidyltransferase family protein [Pseudomonadota bacterium]